MQERLVYIATDGSQFDDPDICQSYERLLGRWEQASHQFSQTVKELGYIKNMMEDIDFFLTPLDEDYCDTSITPSLRFLRFQAFLQELASFMATE